MISLDELRVLARARSACSDALAVLDAAQSLGDLLTHPDAPRWAYGLRRKVPNLSPETRALAEQVACQSPTTS